MTNIEENILISGTVRIFQKGFNYSQDGPGNRLVYHLQGCNLKCPWCSNPEGITFKTPRGYEKDKNFQNVPIDEMVTEIKKCRPLFFDGGGITITGGEVTMQFDAVKNLLEKLKPLGINTLIETNASSPDLRKLILLVDHFIVDYKHYDKENLKRVTGADIDIVEKNIETLLQAKQDVLIRILLVKGFNTSNDDLNGFLKYFTKLREKFAKTSESVPFKTEFLLYHEYGKEKWIKAGMEYKMKDAFVEKEVFHKFAKAFRENDITVIST